MFIYLSKIAYFLMRPSNFLILLGVVGFILLLSRFQLAGRLFLCLSLIGLLIAGFSPAANWLILPLEDRFKRPEKLSGIDGVIILGGGIDTGIAATRGGVPMTKAAERVTVAAVLARKLPDAIFVYSGGAGHDPAADVSEAETASGLLVDLGVDPEHIVLENRSTNTWQNAVFTKNVLKPVQGQKWLLVTSAYHMPRAVGAFRAAGWSGIVPYPVDYRTRGREDRFRGFGDASSGLRRFDTAFREWLGLAAYWLSGRSAELFPGPREG
ncbi:YdcF family protein [Roseibium sp. RKSG952]|uniref:YdcF family protein n=1 Tax=Roseibium sp. RKSG952 TaxID=2529384 RepID=UPI0012BC854A|nr:YdcF family protein [Roseibium sp. RKSG952]MTH96334.1 YdcF family protein [Roseibium sp. RKSG952]